MFKTFVFGIVLGLGGTGALVHYVPVVNQHREASLIEFAVNAGNSELFQIDLPDDRILAGVPGQSATVPAALEWPDHRIFADAQAELFKLRDRDDVVVGIASRISSSKDASGPFVQWMLHLPARGTLFVIFDAAPADGGLRNGTLRGGTGDFANLSGSVTEQFRELSQDPDADTVARIQLVTRLVGQPMEDE